MNLVLATNNKHKVKEIKAMLGNNFDEILTLKDLNIEVEIEENGHTFYDNALIKAKAISKMTNMVALADDSGLEVYCLDNQPSVHSARYAGEPCNDLNNNLKLLKNLENKKDRGARFVSCIVIYYPNGRIVFAEGEVKGEILYDFDGENGFGYDSLFYSYDLNKSFGKASDDEKNSVSHRGNALKEIMLKLK